MVLITAAVDGGLSCVLRAFPCHRLSEKSSVYAWKAIEGPGPSSADWNDADVLAVTQAHNTIAVFGSHWPS